MYPELKTYLADRDTIYDLEEGGKVRRVAVVGDKVGDRQQTATEDRRRRQQAEGNDGLLRDVHLAETKGDEQDETDDEHGQNVVALPAVGRFSGNVEGDKEEGETRGEQEDTED